ncbi:MAG TPA: hypothetical protein PLM95_10535, partial [Ottowia sp.]
MRHLKDGGRAAVVL